MPHPCHRPNPSQSIASSLARLSHSKRLIRVTCQHTNTYTSFFSLPQRAQPVHRASARTFAACCTLFLFLLDVTAPPAAAAMSLQVNILSNRFANPFMNAAGVMCSTTEDLVTMTKSDSGSLVSKSCTPAPRAGNPTPRYRSLPLGSINSMGLPNNGFDFYLDYAAEKHDYSRKPLFLSMSGLSVQENVEMCRRLAAVATEKGVLLELNLSCPNVPGKPQVAYDFDAMREYLTAVSEVYPHSFGVKMPPYFDIAHFDAAAEILNAFPKVQFITCINSIGNGLMIDVETESVMIKPKQGFGGLGGRYILPTALANVNAFYRRCPDKLIFGCGGVYTGEDAFLHVLAGASMVQVGTALYEEGSSIFERLTKELLEVMAKKGYKTLDEFRGKVKTLD
ncbi:dihydroorotate dehydrogenase, putative [Leishmania tarentolae]|uniref:Dihydroorotate dehydrogenase (fumarate) n=1 Tax=Leishmania tarentolae TaxID=5689 RepID=A0A640KE91_LEITA|nr:dihydroorotate dehydrogenase, putative [Leishmania tarentolae]